MKINFTYQETPTFESVFSLSTIRRKFNAKVIFGWENIEQLVEFIFSLPPVVKDDKLFYNFTAHWSKRQIPKKFLCVINLMACSNIIVNSRTWLFRYFCRYTSSKLEEKVKRNFIYRLNNVWIFSLLTRNKCQGLICRNIIIPAQNVSYMIWVSPHLVIPRILPHLLES